MDSKTTDSDEPENDYQCYKCGKYGHFAYHCPMKNPVTSNSKMGEQQKRNRGSVSAVLEENEDVLNCDYSDYTSDDDESVLLESLTLCSTSKPDKSNSLLVSIRLEGKKIQFEVDSGACCTVMSNF